MDGQNNNYQDYTANVQPQNYSAPEEPKKTNALAIVSLVLGILAIVGGCCGWVGILFAIGGIICGVIGNKQQKSGLAIAGIICSIVGLIFGVVLTIFSVIFSAAVLEEMTNMGYYY